MLHSAVSDTIITTRHTLIAVLVIVGAGGPRFVRADEKTLPADVLSSSVEVKVTAVTTRIAGLDNFRGQIDFRVRITNNSDRPLKLDNSQFRCTVDAKPAVFRLGVSDPLLIGSQPVAAGSSREGGLAFQVDRAGVTEPEILLEWSSGEGREAGEAAPVTISINEAVRSHANIRSRRIGPGDSVAVVEIHRPVDFLSIGPLTEEFVRLKQLNVRRVVLDIQGDQRSTSMLSSGYGWLTSVRIGGATARFPIRQQVTSSVQFDEFYVAGLKAAGTSSYRMRLPGLFYGSRAEAVAAALRPVYEQVPLNQVLNDLKHPEDGIRRAALEANIDRLNADELRVVVAEARKRGEDDLSLVAANLHHVALPEVLAFLNELVRDDRTKVSAAALRSLVQSVAPGTRDAVRRYWQEAEDAPKLRQRVIEELMSVKDRRYPDLMAEYTEYQLRAYSTAAAAPDTKSTAGTAPALPEAEGGRRTVTAADKNTLRDLLALLKTQKNSGFVHIARRELLHIAEPVIQDLVVAFVLASGQPADTELVRRFILQRLPAELGPSDGLVEEQQAKLVQRYRPPGGAVKTGFTKDLMTTIRVHPDAAYTKRLLELSQSKAITGTMRADAFRTAVTCATDQQLNDIFDGFDSLDHKQKIYLLKQYSALNDSRWLGLAKQTLMSDQSALSDAVGLLRSDGSPEAVQVLIDCLDELRAASEAAGGVAPKNQKTTMLLLATVNRFSYPAARRSFNRCVTSPVKQIAELTYKVMLAAYRSSPDRQRSTEVRAVSVLKGEGKYAEALEKLNLILNDYPWYYNGYVSRASLHLRVGSPQLAFADLKEADRLNPEDPVIQSLIALADVRMGRAAAGIALAEEVLRSVPDLATFVRKWTIYNTACVYGRAVEREEAGAKKDKMTSRAMELLLASGERKDGIDDVHHILNDPDLTMFHEHPDWPKFLSIVTENEQKRLELKP
jgi:tetratricopeptide (TPR) repeat protein